MSTGSRKIVIVASTFPKNADDSTPHFVLDLAEELSSKYEVTVLTPRIRGAARAEKMGHVDVIRYPYFLARFESLADGAILPNISENKFRLLQVPFLVVATVVFTLRYVKNDRPDLVNAHWIFPSGLAAYFARKRHRTPYLLTIHGADAFALRGAAIGWLKRRVIKDAANVTAVSNEIAEHLRLVDAQVVPMGVDFTRFSQQMAEQTGSRVENQFLFVGRLAEKKGVATLLEAMVAVPDATLKVVGDGPDETSLKTLMQTLGLNERVEFLGAKSLHDVAQLMVRAMFLIIPSQIAANGDREGSPVVMAEAMAARTLVVATPVGGLGEHIVDGETGILAPDCSVVAIASAMQRALDNHYDYSAVTLGAYKYGELNFSLNSVGERYKSLIAEALSR